MYFNISCEFLHTRRNDYQGWPYGDWHMYSSWAVLVKI